MIGVVNYGGGNIQSVRNALAALGAGHQEISVPGHFHGIDAVVFPGQGAFADSMTGLQARGLVEPLRDWILADRPFFGICIGYQLLFESSEENPGVAGLGIFPGRVVKFRETPGLKIPHMGWNTARVVAADQSAWEELGEEPYFYFVHSYYPEPADRSLAATLTGYGGVEFASAVQRGRLLATQFHPEKSQGNGLRLIQTFITRHGCGTPAPPV